jgi:hypothetical protein
MKHEMWAGEDRCKFCDGRGRSLTATDCPGELQTDWHDERIREDGLDFVNGCWVLKTAKPEPVCAWCDLPAGAVVDLFEGTPDAGGTGVETRGQLVPCGDHVAHEGDCTFECQSEHE